MSVDLKFAIGLPPEQAVAYFRAKGLRVSDSWREVWQEAHARAFTVAGVAREDALVDIRKTLDQALAEGKTFAQWRDQVDQALAGRGWIGRAGVDRDGEFHGGKLAPHRLDTIFRTNMQTAYMAGRYRDMRENVEARPYWQYVAILDGRTRPAHRALNGRTFRHDDPFWRTFYPPNGFNCRCRARALAPDQVGDGADQSPLSSSEGKLSSAWVTPFKGRAKVRTERFEYLPGKTVTPDPGWAYNPGAARPIYDPAGVVPDGAGPARMVEGQRLWKDYGRPDLRQVGTEGRQAAPPRLAAGGTAEEAKAILAQALGVSERAPTRLVRTPVGDQVIDYGYLGHIVEKRQEARERYGNFVLPTLARPFEVWRTDYDDGLERLRFIGLFDAAADVMVVVRVNRDGSVVWNMMQAADKNMNKARVGRLVWPRPRDDSV